MKFLLVIKQKGSGCDYMVGCGTKLYEFDAETPELAAQIAIKKLEDCGFLMSEECMPSRDRALDSVYLFDLSACVPIPVEEESGKRMAAYQAEQAAVKKAKDEAEFERLRKKLGR